MNKNQNYHDELDIKNTIKLRELLSTLPPFCGIFFRGISNTTASKTRIAYAYDIRVFFEFIQEHHLDLKDTSITQFSISILDDITKLDIEEYLEYCSYYEKNNVKYTNNERGKSRKLASLKSMYHYYFKSELIKTNPAALVSMPKIHQKEIVRLDIDEIAILLDQVEGGLELTKGEERYHKKTKIRDLSLLTLLLGTGIRVSECVGINLNDIDYKNQGIKIRRKGGYESVVYFGNEVAKALEDYYQVRKNIIPEVGNEDAFFLSLQNKRINVRSVEKLVKKYAQKVTTLKKITPHKLRSTYGTNLYKESGDIYLVAEVLGHKDVNTTKKHYAAIGEEERRRAAKFVKLREP